MVKEETSIAEHRAFLLAAVAWQETLLQSYRSLHVTIQGFLLASSSAVLAVQLTGAVQEQTSKPIIVFVFNLIFSALLGLLFWLQSRTAKELRGIVESRAADINHWHMELMFSENELNPSKRAFTYFKTWQHAHRADVTHVLPNYLPEAGLTPEKAEELISKGLGHTRKILDVSLFDRLHLLCLGILLTSWSVTIWFAIALYNSGVGIS